MCDPNSQDLQLIMCGVDLIFVHSIEDGVACTVNITHAILDQISQKLQLGRWTLLERCWTKPKSSMSGYNSCSFERVLAEDIGIPIIYESL